MQAELPRASQVVADLERAVRGEGQPSIDGDRVLTLTRRLLESNLRQWELEDVTRQPDAPDADVAAAKRAIDRLNLGRHELIEQIDAAVDETVRQTPAAALATESPGMVLDRLSVLVIRIARTEASAARAPENGHAGRLPALRAQLDALASAFDVYLDDLRLGRRRYLRYEHFKLYDDSGGAF